MLTACRNGDLRLVGGLLSKNPALGLCDYNYMTPLHLAVGYGSVALVRARRRAGADAYVADHDGRTVHEEPPPAQQAQSTAHGGIAVVRHGPLPELPRPRPGARRSGPRQVLPVDDARVASGRPAAHTLFPSIGVELRGCHG